MTTISLWFREIPIGNHLKSFSKKKRVRVKRSIELELSYNHGLKCLRKTLENAGKTLERNPPSPSGNVEWERPSHRPSHCLSTLPLGVGGGEAYILLLSHHFCP